MNGKDNNSAEEMSVTVESAEPSPAQIPMPVDKPPRSTDCQYVAECGIDNDELDVHLQPGDPVPPALIHEAPWLIEQGLVKAISNAAQHASETEVK